jgi:pimeloyl-ACP methyl ester carboxylesterase
MTIDGPALLARALRIVWWCAMALAVLLLAWFAANAVRVLVMETQTPEQASPDAGRWVQAHDTRLHVVEHGKPGDPVLVLVAGTGAWAGTWRDSIEPIVRAGWRVLAIDLPPFGFSHRPPNASYGRREQAQRLLAAIRELAPAPVVLLGHSYGGGPAAEAAMLDSSRIRHLILVDAAIGLRADGAPACEPPGPLTSLLGWRPVGTTLVAGTGTQPLLTGTLLRGFVARKEVLTADRIAIYRQPLGVRGTSAAIADWALTFAAECAGPHSTTPAGFAALRMPLTLLWGELDTVTPPAQAGAIAAATPGAKLLMLPGAGHIPQIEDPAQFNRTLVHTLDALRQPSPAPAASTAAAKPPAAASGARR